MKSGNLNFLEPSGPLQACNGTALPFLITIKYQQKYGSIERLRLVYTHFPEILELPPNFKRQNGEVMQVPYWELTDIRRRYTKFSRDVDLTPDIVYPSFYLYLVVL